jgi:hypothetical protein
MTDLHRQRDAAANMAAMKDMRDRFESLSREYPEPELLWEPLRDTVRDLLQEGYPREVVLGALDDFRYVLRAGGRDELEDDVVDVMGFMAGWSNSRLAI